MHEPLDPDGSLLELVLPNSNNLHAPSAQMATDTPIASAISADLSSPKLGVLPRLLKALWATMPKTSVDENGQAPAAEEKVRTAEYVGRMQAPTANSGTPEHRGKPALGTPIPAAADCRHDE